MRLTKFTFVLLCSTLVGTCGLARPSISPAAENRYASYYQPADEESPPPEDTGDEAPSDEAQPPEETTDEAPSDEMPAEEVSDEERTPDEGSTDDEPLERQPADETPDEPAPPTPVMEDDYPVDTKPSRREITPLPDTTTTPNDDMVAPGQSHGAYGSASEPKGWGYNGGCCAGVWDGYCDELPGCHHGGRGHGRGCGHGHCCGHSHGCVHSRLWRRMMCRQSTQLGGRNKCCQRQHGSCHRQCGVPSCCRAATKVDDNDSVAPPAPPEPVPYASAARSSRKSSAVVLQHWDMPRITSQGGKTRKRIVD
ncbi:MAG TPA: hypothetical protein VMV69_00310 [Pirellulales bacterium]|nr:hypothetical protein [Pirellulales bacterium]